MCAEATNNIKHRTAKLSLTLTLSRREREPSGSRFAPHRSLRYERHNAED